MGLLLTITTAEPVQTVAAPIGLLLALTLSIGAKQGRASASDAALYIANVSDARINRLSLSDLATGGAEAEDN